MRNVFLARGSSITSFGRKSFPALYQRNFRVFWIGQCVSLIGTWMQNVGQAWLVLEMTGSAAKLALVMAAQFLPMMALSIVVGPFIDRFPKRKTLIATQSALAILALALAFVAWAGIAQYWMIVVLALLLGVVQLIDNPTRQAYVIELAGREALMNAVSLNSAAFNLARIVGPAIAGVAMEALGIAPCFFLNALSFLAVIAALLAVDAPVNASGRVVGSVRDVLSSARDGLRYIARRPRIAVPLALMAVISTFVINYTVFVPSFAKIDLGRSASGFGFLMTAMGIGSLVAALALAVRSGKGPSPARLYGGAAGTCAALALCGLQRDYALSCALLGVVGFCTISFSASTNAMIQLESEDGYRGRVMSVYSLTFGGLTPIGSLWAGIVSDAIGPAACMAISGAIGLVACAFAVFFARRRHVAA